MLGRMTHRCVAMDAANDDTDDDDDDDDGDEVAGWSVCLLLVIRYYYYFFWCLSVDTLMRMLLRLLLLSVQSMGCSRWPEKSIGKTSVRC